MENEHNIPGYGLTDEAKQWYDTTIRETARIPQPEELEQAAPPSAAPEEQPSFLSETGAAFAGGAADAVESVGGFAELVGDTFKTGFNQVVGRPVDDTQNPFSNNYVHNDAGWLDIPDTWVPENKTGLGKLARGLVEFGLLTAATGGVGGATFGGARLGVRGLAAARAAGMGAKGVRNLKFVGTTAKIAGEGAIADLISSSSEAGNIANLAAEHTPWMAPWVTNALAIAPEDNPWLARIKTVASGAGVNLIGHGITAFAKGSWAAHRARAAGKSVDEANEIGNKVMAKEMDDAAQLDEAAAKEMADDRYAQGSGIKGTPDEMGRTFDPFVNYTKYDNVERATYRAEPDAVKANLREGINDMKQGGEGKSYTPMATESSLNKMSRGDKNLREYILEVADDLTSEAFKSLDNTMDYKEVQQLIIRQASELTSMMEEGGDVAKRFADYFEKQDKNARVYIDDGNKIVTGSPAQKAALQLVINNLARQAQGIATGTLYIADDLPINRQVEMVFDSMKVALTEHKKMGYMWGLDGKYQQIGLMPKSVRKQTEATLQKISDDMDEYFGALHELHKQNRYQEMADLMELHALSGGKVRTLEHLHDYLKAKIRGGELDGNRITGRVRKELQSTFYNSVLSSLKTPVKAIAGTNLIGVLRPFQAYIGASLRGNKKEAVIAAATIDSLGKAFAEGFQMFKYNWDLGINRKTLSYEGKFDLEADLAEWQSLKGFYDRYGSSTDKRAYEALDRVVKFNTNPWVKYSQNAMGAGDALARTIIGRYEMRMRATRAAIDKGVDLDDAMAVARETEENFRNELFKLDANNRYIVSDKAAKMAGDEAAMTRALEENFKGFELIANIPGMKAFFPFVRTGFNALNLTFEHTPLAMFMDKYKDIMKGKNLDRYGIRPEDLPQAQALMEGRIAMGSTIMGMATIAAMSGNLTGDYPYTKEDRDAWQLAGIQPYSFKFGDTYISYKDLEPFNTLFSMTANVVGNADLLGEKVTDNWLQKLTFMTAAVLVDKSMLAGVEDLARLMNAETSEELLQSTGSRYIRSHLPYAGLMGQLGDILDANRKEATTLGEMLIRRDVVKGALPAKYDVLAKDRSGKKLNYGSENPLLRLFNSLSPIPITFADDDPVKKGLVEMRYNLPEALTTYKGEPLNSLERSELQKYMSMGNLRSRLEKVMVKERYWRENLDRYKKENLTINEGYQLYSQKFYILVDRIFQEEKRLAMIEVLRNNPDLAARIELREAKKAISRSGSYDKIVNLPK